MATKIKLDKRSSLTIYSFFPIDPGDCECMAMVKEWKDKLLLTPPDKREALVEKTGHLVCPRDKSSMRRYEITCKVCGQVEGYCWATNSTLADFCDFHYVNWTDGELWYGCLTPNISPITQELTLECTCGQDTRDFRANMTLSAKKAIEIERGNSIGRKFGDQKSKFKVMEVRKNG